MNKCPYCMVQINKSAKYCPQCGVQLSFAKTGEVESIIVSGSDHKEVDAVAKSLSGNNSEINKLEIRLKELESEYELAKMGMLKGGLATVGAVVAGLFSLGAALFAFLKKGPGFLSGTHLVIIYGLMIAGLVIFFSFVFGRAARVKMEINKTKKKLEMSSGANVRK